MKDVDCRYQAEAILVKPKENFSGLTYVTVKIKNADNETAAADILVKVKKRAGLIVKYNSQQPVKEVSIAGSFNGWNKNAARLKKNENGEYSAELELSPGKYQYKFVVDGVWLLDSQNPDKAPDGFGGYNSVLTVGGEKPELLPLTKNGKLKFAYTGQQLLSCLSTVNNKVVIPKIEKNIIEIEMEQMSHLDFKIIASDKLCNFSDEICFSAKKDFNWNDGILYFVFIDRFADGDKKNNSPVSDNEVEKLANYLGGDFQGVIDKIKDGYFKKLGVNILWLSPVADNPNTVFQEDNPPYKKYSAYHGYWPVDIYKVEEHFGNEEKLKELVALAHKNGLKVILDGVFNHVHIDSEIYKKNPQWFTPLLLSDGRKNIRLFDEYPLSTWFDSFNPTFDFENNPEARKIMIENGLWWIKEFNIDGYRLDAVKHVAHIFWKELKERIKNEIEVPQNKTFFMIGETISSREKIKEYVNDEELNSQFDFPLYWAIRDVFAWETRGFDILSQELKSSQGFYGMKNPMSTLLGNHDFARFTALADGDVKQNMNDKDEKIVAKIDNPETYKKLKLAWTFLLTNPGMPMIYYGDEIGISGKGDPDNRRLMTFDFTKQEKDVFDYVSALIKIRKENAATRYGINKTVLAENDFYAYKNVWFDNEILVVLNRSDKNVSKYLHLEGKWQNLFTGKKCELEKIEVGPKSALVFRKI